MSMATQPESYLRLRRTEVPSDLRLRIASRFLMNRDREILSCDPRIYRLVAMCWDSIYWPRILGAQASTLSLRSQLTSSLTISGGTGQMNFALNSRRLGLRCRTPLIRPPHDFDHRVRRHASLIEQPKGERRNVSLLGLAFWRRRRDKRVTAWVKW